MPRTTVSTRINARLSSPLAELVDRMVGDNGLYESPAEYIRDLIRRDMRQRDGKAVHAAILAGYRDLAAGAVFESSGNFDADMELLERRQAEGWR